MKKTILGIIIGLSFVRASFARITQYERTYVFYLKEDTSTYDANPENYLFNWKSKFYDSLPVLPEEIIFFGDSITQFGEWSELLSNVFVRNRGIAGDITYGLLKRVSSIAKRRPSALFIMIGINDIVRKIPLRLTLRNYGSIIDIVKRNSPMTKIYIQSVLPINENMIGREYFSGNNNQIFYMNSELKKLAKEKNVNFIDLHRLFYNPLEGMPARYSLDGLHLTAEGYILWTDYLKERGYVKSMFK